MPYAIVQHVWALENGVTGPSPGTPNYLLHTTYSQVLLLLLLNGLSDIISGHTSHYFLKLLWSQF